MELWYNLVRVIGDLIYLAAALLTLAATLAERINRRGNTSGTDQGVS